MGLLVLSALLAAAGCVTRPVAAPATTAATRAPNKFADATLRQLATAQDERSTAALLP